MATDPTRTTTHSDANKSNNPLLMIITLACRLAGTTPPGPIKVDPAKLALPRDLSQNWQNRPPPQQAPAPLPGQEHKPVAPKLGPAWTKATPPQPTDFVPPSAPEPAAAVSTAVQIAPAPAPDAAPDAAPNTDMASNPVNDGTWHDFLDHLQLRESYENEAYYDSEGHLTIGVGHLIKPGDGLYGVIKEGDRISDAQVRALLEEDARKAYQAAIDQANELGINDSDFVVQLGSTNFQLGTSWKNEHTKTWGLMVEGKYEEAAVEAANSRWNEQTPVRVADLQNALYTQAKKAYGAANPNPNSSGPFAIAAAGDPQTIQQARTPAPASGTAPSPA